MATAQRINANAVEALKEALSVVFWRKRDLLDYLRASIPDQQLLDGIDWLSQDVYKRDSVRRFIDRLATRQDAYGGLLLRLMSDVAAMDDFPQLAWLEDAPGKIARAKEAVARLRKYIQPYEEQLAAEAAASARITQAKAEARLRQGTAEALRALRQEYFELLAMDDAQRRGFTFERWLHTLFELFDLDPRASEPRRRREDHHRSVCRAESRRDSFHLLPGLERPLLLRSPLWVRNAELGGVLVEQTPSNGAIEYLPKRLRRLVAVSLGNSQPPRVDVLG